MTSPEPLVDAITHASPDLLQVLFRIAFFDGCKEAVERQFLVQSTAAENSPLIKRRRHEVCGRCNQAFDMTMNSDNACKWHCGTLNINWDIGYWKYHDEDRDGKIDTDEMRMMFPERFIWSCCSKQGDVKQSGCRWSHHMELDYPTKRFRQ